MIEAAALAGLVDAMSVYGAALAQAPQRSPLGEEAAPILLTVPTS